MPTGTEPPPLRERDRELAELTAALEAARAGAGRLLVLEGPAGIGKTALLDALRAEARRADLRVLHARGSELESRFPFGMVHQLLGPLVFAASADEHERWFGGAARFAADLFTDGGRLSIGGDDLYPLLHGLYWLCAALAQERPLVLAFDDVQWADELSLRFLLFLARRLEELPLLLAVGMRPPRDVGQEMLAALPTGPVARVLRPALSEAEVARWVEDSLAAHADAGFVRAVHATTDGNPLLVGELLRDARAAGLTPDGDGTRRVAELAPSGVTTVVLRRLSALPEGALALAQAVAVLGDGATVSASADLAGLADAAPVVAALERAGILDGRSGLAFAHPLVRRAIYQDMPAPDRAELHARAVAILTARRASGDELAAHLLMSEPAGSPEAVAVLRTAAARSLSLGAAGTAVAYLERALAEGPDADTRPALLAELGQARGRAGSEGAAGCLTEALELTRDPAERARIALQLARVLKFGGDAVRAVGVLGQWGAGAADPALAADIEHERIGLAYISAGARALLADRIRGLEPVDGDPCTLLEAFTLAALAFDAAASGLGADRAAALATRALVGGVLPSDPTAGGYGRLIAGVALMWSDRLDDALGVFAHVRADARAQGSAVAYAAAAAMDSLIHWRAGALAEAEADVAAATALASDMGGDVTLLTAARAVSAVVAVERGAPEHELQALLAELADVHQDTDELPYHLIRFARGVLREALGDTAGALAELHACGTLEVGWGATSPTVSGWRPAAALLHHARGEADQARALAAEDVELARAFGAPRALGIALRARPLVAADRRADGLREAVAVLEQSPARLELARALVDLGAELRAAGDPAGAREPLRRAQEITLRCGAGRLHERAQAELRAAGARPRRVALSGVEALTPSERRVAELAAAGGTNREIAQELFVTEKTVENHLGRAFAKLAIKSRRQLAAALDGAAQDGAYTGTSDSG